MYFECRGQYVPHLRDRPDGAFYSLHSPGLVPLSRLRRTCRWMTIQTQPIITYTQSYSLPHASSGHQPAAVLTVRCCLACRISNLRCILIYVCLLINSTLVCLMCSLSVTLPYSYCTVLYRTDVRISRFLIQPSKKE
jgi:hypothetical protein